MNIDNNNIGHSHSLISHNTHFVVVVMISIFTNKEKCVEKKISDQNKAMIKKLKQRHKSNINRESVLVEIFQAILLFANNELTPYIRIISW